MVVTRDSVIFIQAIVISASPPYKTFKLPKKDGKFTSGETKSWTYSLLAEKDFVYSELAEDKFTIFRAGTTLLSENRPECTAHVITSGLTLIQAINNRICIQNLPHNLNKLSSHWVTLYGHQGYVYKLVVN